jgi:hypothetical protein
MKLWQAIRIYFSLFILYFLLYLARLLKKKKKVVIFVRLKEKRKKKVSKGDGNVYSHLCTRESTSPTKGGWRESRLQPDRVIFQEC